MDRALGYEPRLVGVRIPLSVLSLGSLMEKTVGFYPTFPGSSPGRDIYREAPELESWGGL